MSALIKRHGNLASVSFLEARVKTDLLKFLCPKIKVSSPPSLHIYVLSMFPG